MSTSPPNPRLPEVNFMEGDGVRYMHFETPWIQGAMRVDAPDEIELDYVQRMMAWMLFRDEAVVTEGHAVQLGLGAATITRFCHKRLKMRTTAVEINRNVIEACRLWFRLPRDTKLLHVLEMDAAAWVADPANRGTVDALSVDLYDQEAARPVLDSVEFYRDCRAVLSEGGVMAVNLFGRRASFPLSFARLVEAFGADQVHALKPTPEGNTIVIAMNHVTVPGRDVLARRAENIETRWKLPASKWLRMLKSLPDDAPASLPELPPA
ncbi:MAG: spermidine synthase [Burkholderiales bacterium]|nr:spermidine synthase [Burkholderiales bacterium]